MSGHLVFVYGSLKAAFHNHRLLVDHDAVDLGYAVTDERYLMLKGNAFPFLLKQPAHAQIAGELYRVDDACLAALDRLESHPRFYRREPIMVNGGVEAWCYFIRPERMASVPLPNRAGIVEWTRDDVTADEPTDAEE